MNRLKRRDLLRLAAAAGTAGTLRLAPLAGPKLAGRRVLRLVYDKRRGMLRAIDRIVP